jgi:glycosyltransferase involved in cell wall biosynthesis
MSVVGSDVGVFSPLDSPVVHFPQHAPVDHQHTPVKRAHRASILHVINGEHYSGAERVQDLLAACLPDLGYNVGFACVKPKHFPDKRQTKSAPIFSLDARAKADFQMSRWLASIAREGKYSLLHAHTPRSLIIASMASFWSGLPLVYHVHSPTARDTSEGWKNWAKSWTERVGLFPAAKMICVSHSLRRHMHALGYREQKIAVVHNGVPAREQVPRRMARKSIFVFGSMALMRPRKGMEVLLEAMAKLRHGGFPLFRLRAVGPFESSDYEASLKRKANDLGVADYIEWTGFRGDVHAELDQMDALILPSLYGEGLPMVVLEAMASGVPVVASDVEGVVEAIEDGVEGLLVPPASAEQLAGAMRRLLSGEIEWHAMADAARSRHAVHFSAERMAQGVADVYDEVLR